MPQTIIQIHTQVPWRVFRDDLSARWIGICDPLRITIEGTSEGDLVETMVDAMDGLMHDLVATGEFDQYLRDRGWRVLSEMPEKIDQSVRFSIPMDIAFRPASEFQTALH